MTEPVKEIAAMALAAVMAAAIATALAVLVLWALTVIGRLSEAILMVMGVL
jgi:hypothetical protein